MRIGEFELNDTVPELKEPHVLAVLRPWIDVGSVGTLGLGRLERHLHAQEMGRLVKPGRFYDFTRYRPRTIINQGKREMSVPSTVIRYAVREEGPDLVFLHLLEPHNYGEDFTDSVVEVLKHIGAKRYTLVGAMYDMVPHTRPLLVSCGEIREDSEEEYKLYEAKPSTYEGPTTITYVISQTAEEMGVDTRIFVVHLPQYFQVDEDFTGTARLMEILCRQYHLPGRLEDKERGTQQYAALQNIVDDASEVSGLLKRLEEKYDQDKTEGSAAPPQLAPNIEQFLQEMNEDFDQPQK